MTKTELKKLKELDTFLRERNMQLRSTNIIVRFNADKCKINSVQLDLDMNWDVGYSNIKELNETPTIKNHYYIQKGKLKQYLNNTDI
jgi:hypothetical protein